MTYEIHFKQIFKNVPFFRKNQKKFSKN